MPPFGALRSGPRRVDPCPKPPDGPPQEFMVDTTSPNSSLESLLKALTVDELRDTVLALRGPEASTGRKKDDLVRDVLSAGSQERVEEVAARVEALSPRKHLWLFSLTGVTPQALAAADRQRIEGSGELKTFRRLAELDPASVRLQLRLVLQNPTTGTVYLKYEHWVTARAWQNTNATTKVLTTQRVRHSVTAAVRPDHGVLEVMFDGFSQGISPPKEERKSYDDIASEAAADAAKLLGFSLTNISLASAVERLLDTAPEEVGDARRSLRPTGGGQYSLNAGDGDDVDVAGHFIDFLATATDGRVRLSRDDMRTALRSTPADSVFLVWRKEDLLTRVTNHPVGPEILFVWRSVPRSTRVIHRVVDALLAAYRAVGTASPHDVLRYVRELPAQHVTRVSDVMGRFRVSAEDALATLERSRAEDVVRRVYRFRTQRALHSYRNTWRESLAELPTSVQDEEGRTLSLDDASAIEVGYQRSAPTA